MRYFALFFTLLLAGFAHAETDLIPFPVAFSDNFVDMGNNVYHQMPAASFGYSLSIADVTQGVNNANQINRSIGIYVEGAFSQGVNSNDNVLGWADGGAIVSVDGIAFKIGPQIAGEKQGTGMFYGFTALLPIPDFFDNLKIKL